MIQIENTSNQRILISVLNWGMGHVSRSIGLIHQLKQKGNTIIIAGSEEQNSVFKEYFPGIEFIVHDGYPFVFKGKGNFSIDLLLQSKSLLKRLKKEKKEVESYVDEYKIDLILSDHRYGFIHDVIPSVFITHQLTLPIKWCQKGVQKLHNKLISSFNSIWVLDDENSSLSGKLSKNKESFPVQYIGPYSRFMTYDIPENKKDLTVYIASGPTIYAQDFVDNYCKNVIENEIVIASREVIVENKVEDLSWKEKDKLILLAKEIISRSGYSTIMDVFFLKCDTKFHPTKGQMEQEYLAKLHKKSPTI